MGAPAVDLTCEQALELAGERGGVDDILLGLWSLLPLVVVLELARLEGEGEVPPLEQTE